MRNNILTLLVGFVVMLGSVMLFKLGLDKMTDAGAAPQDQFASMDVDLNRRAILYRVQAGDTFWALAERFYGSGRRWSEISGANGLNPDAGLQAGTVIRIPLAADDDEPAPVAEPVKVADMPDAPSPGKFSIDDAALSVALARLDGKRFPAGALCVARTTESQRVRLNVFDAHLGGEGAPLAIYEAPDGNFLRDMQAEDLDGDGKQELYTIWHTKTDSATSRVLQWADNELRVVSETPDDPRALLRLRAKDAR
jgi:hypothetical protein